MKTLKIVAALVITICSFSSKAQTKQTLQKETVKVWGNCEMCKSRIEKAAKAAGAKSAVWNVDTKILSVSYNPSQSSIDKIESLVANAGYDTGSVTAKEETYKSLPECCQYDRKPVEDIKRN